MSIGRNDPCHCGSGQKYKKCHAAADEAKERAELAAQAAARAAQAAAEAEKEETAGNAPAHAPTKGAPARGGVGATPKQTGARVNPAMRPKRAV